MVLRYLLCFPETGLLPGLPITSEFLCQQVEEAVRSATVADDSMNFGKLVVLASVGTVIKRLSVELLRQDWCI